MLLIARYDCFVSGKPTESVDYQVRTYDVPENTDLEAMLKDEPTHCYQNESNEKVEWRYTEIVAAEWDVKFEQGEEIIGFITGKPVPVAD